MGFGLEDVFGIIANPGQFYGTNGLIGGAINDITGASNSAKTQYQNSLKLQKNAQEFAKWQMQNAHQMEAQDLDAAGLNRVLAAGGTSATPSPSANSASTGVAGTDPISMIGSIVNMVNSAKQTKATIDKINTEIKNETNLTNANVKNINAETKLTNTTNRNANTKTTQMENDERLAKSWWGRNISPVLRDIFGTGGGQAVMNSATSARNANHMADAIKKTPHTHVHYH